MISKITEIAARKRDENHFVLGPVTLVCGILLAALLLPLDCARVGIFALAFGDGLASLMGKLFGKITIPGAHGKTAAGSVGRCRSSGCAPCHREEAATHLSLGQE